MRSFSVLEGDVSAILPTLDAESFDAVLCDPPYGLSFMGKAWDHGVPSADVWAAVSRVLKPGAHLIAFGGTRTFHRLTCAIEDAGFEIRDCLCWLYGQGFPKSHNLKGAFQGYGTALKPAWEPAILAMKPTDGTFAANALAYGVAGLNVDGCRIGVTVETWPATRSYAPGQIQPGGKGATQSTGCAPPGRWPANVALDEEAAAMLPTTGGGGKPKTRYRAPSAVQYTPEYRTEYEPCPDALAGGGPASRFFYTAKASRGEREAGLREAGLREAGSTHDGYGSIQRDFTPSRVRNHHPTVKPIALAEWLAKLLLPPKRDTPRRLLVPFSGSGSEIMGALRVGWDQVVGIELDPEYAGIARARIRGDAPLLNQEIAE